MPKPPAPRAADRAAALAAATASDLDSESPGVALGLAHGAVAMPAPPATAVGQLAPGQHAPGDLCTALEQHVLQTQTEMMNSLDMRDVGFHYRHQVSQLLARPPLPDPCLHAARRPPIPAVSPRSASKDPGMLAITLGELGGPGEGSESSGETDGEGSEASEESDGGGPAAP